MPLVGACRRDATQRFRVPQYSRPVWLGGPNKLKALSFLRQPSRPKVSKKLIGTTSSSVTTACRPTINNCSVGLAQFASPVKPTSTSYNEPSEGSNSLKLEVGYTEAVEGPSSTVRVNCSVTSSAFAVAPNSPYVVINAAAPKHQNAT